MINGYNKKLEGLELSIINNINAIKIRKLQIKQSIYEIVSVLSLIAIMPVIYYIINSFSSSAIYDYITLIFYDINALAYWKELSLSILESMPFMGLAVGLGFVAIFLLSILKTLKIQVLKNSLA